MSIIEARTFLEAEALANLGFEFIGLNDDNTTIQFKEPDRNKR